jgi:hypothetical protein
MGSEFFSLRCCTRPSRTVPSAADMPVALEEPPAPKQPFTDALKDLALLMAGEGESVKVISRQLGVNYCAVYNFLKRNGRPVKVRLYNVQSRRADR